jgi:hypothetical protein
MTALSPEWHEEARRMAKRGKTVGQIAAALGKGKTTVRCVIDEAARQRLLLSTKAHKARIRAEMKGTRVREPSHGRDYERRVVQTAYEDKIQRAPAPISLAPITILLTKPANEAKLIRFAPKPRIKEESPGARRWREIHEAMIRRGVIHVRGLLEELHP